MTAEQLIERLAGVSDQDCPMQNPYRNEVCRYNLKHYLDYLSGRRVDIMLIGEAPGYRGCALTGIPFTDEVQLKLSENDFALGGWCRHERTGCTSERSASAIWEMLRKYHIVPLMWNIFPFHPCQEGKLRTNRTPTPAELSEGLDYVHVLMSMFSVDRSNVYAIGKKALMTIDFLDNDHYIRHPANDCRREFPIQFDQKIGRLYGRG